MGYEQNWKDRFPLASFLIAGAGVLATLGLQELAPPAWLLFTTAGAFLVAAISYRWFLRNKRRSLFGIGICLAYLVLALWFTTIHRTPAPIHGSEPPSATTTTLPRPDRLQKPDEPTATKQTQSSQSLKQIGRQSERRVSSPPPIVVHQRSQGPNSPNIATFGANSPVTITNPPTPIWGLSRSELDTLIAQMTPFATKDREVLIDSNADDPDSERFARSLDEAFRLAGWNRSGSGFSSSVRSDPIEGVVVQVHRKTEQLPALNEFVSILGKAGISPTGLEDERVPSGSFWLIIGSRPRQDR